MARPRRSTTRHSEGAALNSRKGTPGGTVGVGALSVSVGIMVAPFAIEHMCYFRHPTSDIRR
ncbi:hypothetical protein GCM10027024_08050 [Microbacterium insulae]